MSRYFIDMDGEPRDQTGRDYATIDEARDAAIVQLGRYLQENPGFAHARHWRVDVRDHARRLLLHVIVATVDAPPAINRASFQE